MDLKFYNADKTKKLNIIIKDFNAIKEQTFKDEKVFIGQDVEIYNKHKNSIEPFIGSGDPQKNIFALLHYIEVVSRQIRDFIKEMRVYKEFINYNKLKGKTLQLLHVENIIKYSELTKIAPTIKLSEQELKSLFETFPHSVELYIMSLNALGFSTKEKLKPLLDEYLKTFGSKNNKTNPQDNLFLFTLSPDGEWKKLKNKSKCTIINKVLPNSTKFEYKGLMDKDYIIKNNLNYKPNQALNDDLIKKYRILHNTNAKKENLSIISKGKDIYETYDEELYRKVIPFEGKTLEDAYPDETIAMYNNIFENKLMEHHNPIKRDIKPNRDDITSLKRKASENINTYLTQHYKKSNHATILTCNDIIDIISSTFLEYGLVDGKSIYELQTAQYSTIRKIIETYIDFMKYRHKTKHDTDQKNIDNYKSLVDTYFTKYINFKVQIFKEFPHKKEIYNSYLA